MDPKRKGTAAGSGHLADKGWAERSTPGRSRSQKLGTEGRGRRLREGLPRVGAAGGEREPPWSRPTGPATDAP